MKDALVVTIASAKEVQSVGGKGHGLGEMVRAGFTVPEGFVVTAKAYDAMTPALKTEILKHFDDLNAQYVAVRSSAVSEDGASAAWAGQLDTFLNVTKGNIVQNIEKVWHSISSPRAQAYAKEHGVTVGPVAVVIQKMIQSEVSGIAFSVHPITKDTNQIIIEAGLGLGEAIVSGQITPDTYIFQKDSEQLLQKHLAHQSKKLVQDESGKTVWEELATNDQTQKLTDAQIVQLGKIIKKLENYFGFPVDVEWALHNNTLYLLQCRPITTL